MSYVWALLIGLAALLIVLVVRHDSGTVLGLDIGSFGRMGVLLALLAFVSVGVFRGLRASDVLKNALIWVLIALALVTIYSFKTELQMVANRVTGELIPGMALTSVDGNSITVSRGRNGHFSLSVEIEGTPVDMLVDTGASTVVLTYEDAQKVGIDVGSLSFQSPVETANGMTFFARVVLESIKVENIEMDTVRAAIAQQGNLKQSLLGNSFLDRLSSYEFTGSQLVLRP